MKKSTKSIKLASEASQADPPTFIGLQSLWQFSSSMLVNSFHINTLMDLRIKVIIFSDCYCILNLILFPPNLIDTLQGS